MITTNEASPERQRTAIKFSDGSFGMVVSGAKLKSDAQNLRWICGLITSGTFGNADEAARAVGALKSMADQFEMAAAGNEPQAQ